MYAPRHVTAAGRVCITFSSFGPSFGRACHSNVDSLLSAFMSTYVEMLARTTVMKIHNEAVKNEFVAHGETS